MSRLGLAAAATVGLALACGGGLFLWGLVPADMGPRVQAAPHIVGVQTGGSYAWIVVLDGEPVLVDGGMDERATAIVAELADQGFTRRDVRTILLTHGHPDHIGGLGTFPEATVHAHPDDLRLLDGSRPQDSLIASLLMGDPPVLAHPPVPSPDGARVSLPGGHEATAIHVPGHTSGSTAWVVADTLFIGDALLPVAGHVELPSRLVTADPERAAASVARLADLTPARLCDGHVGTMPEPHDAIAAFLGAHR